MREPFQKTMHKPDELRRGLFNEFGREEIIEVPRVWRSAIPRAATALLASLILLPASNLLGSPGFEIPLLLFSLKTPYVVLFLLPLFVRPVLYLYDAKHFITPKGVVARSGIYSFVTRDMHADFHDISGVSVRQSLFERLINIGTIDVGTAMSANVEIVIEGVDSPSKYADIMDDREEHWHQEYARENANLRALQGQKG